MHNHHSPICAPHSKENMTITQPPLCWSLWVKEHHLPLPRWLNNHHPWQCIAQHGATPMAQVHTALFHMAMYPCIYNLDPSHLCMRRATRTVSWHRISNCMWNKHAGSACQSGRSSSSSRLKWPWHGMRLWWEAHQWALRGCGASWELDWWGSHQLCAHVQYVDRYLDWCVFHFYLSFSYADRNCRFHGVRLK